MIQPEINTFDLIFIEKFVSILHDGLILRIGTGDSGMNCSAPFKVAHTLRENRPLMTLKIWKESH